MKKSSLTKACLNLSFLFTFVLLFSSSVSFAAPKAGAMTGRIFKAAMWLNYPNAINGQQSMSFCNDIVTETTIIPQSNIQDGDVICQCQTYRFTLPFHCASVSWGLYNASIVYSYSDYDKVIQFTSNILVDGYANVWVTVIDPATGDPYFYEMAFTPWVECCE